MNIFNLNEKELEEFLNKELNKKYPKELLNELVDCGLEVENDEEENDMKPINAAKNGKLKLEWYCLNHDFNSKNIYNLNILDRGYLLDLIRMIEDKYYNVHDYDSLKECIKRWSNYHFNHKTEYEIWVHGWFDKEGVETKISVYDQLEPNLDILTKYINDNLKIVEVK